MSTRMALWPVALLATIVLLFFAKSILVPVLLAILLTQLLSPVVKRLERLLPTGVATFVALLVAGTLVYGFVVLLSTQLAALQDKFPEIRARLEDEMLLLQTYMATHFGMAPSKQLGLLNKGIESSLGAGGGLAVSAVSFTLSTLAESALIVILTFLMLYYRRHFRRQLRLLAEKQHWRTFGEVLESVALLGQGYVAGLALVICMVGVLDTAGFFLVRAPFPALFGVLGALAVLIPYVGIVIVAPFCMLLTFVTTGSWGMASGVLLIYGVIHFLEGNVFSPFLVGSKVDLNPLATILAVIIGGELWGPAGMLLFIPLAGIIKLTLDALPDAQPVARLLGPISEEDLAPRWRLRALMARRLRKNVVASEIPVNGPSPR